MPRQPEESVLTPLTDGTRAMLSRHGVVFNDGVAETARDVRLVQIQRSISTHLLWLVLALFLAEGLLSLFFKRQRSTRRSVVPTPIPATAR
ncbi:MAG: hypothetical protein M3463_11360 [Verrucomicrobiota bacterium]|nr:hypothetical protein [Verrucomicrobiota bacterium]